MRNILQEKRLDYNTKLYLFPQSHGFVYHNEFTIKCCNIIEGDYDGVFIENIKSGYKLSFLNNQNNISYLKFRGKSLYRIKYSL